MFRKVNIMIVQLFLVTKLSTCPTFACSWVWQCDWTLATKQYSEVLMAFFMPDSSIFPDGCQMGKVLEVRGLRITSYCRMVMGMRSAAWETSSAVF